MAGDKGVAWTLGRLREAGNAAERAQRSKGVSAPGQDLMHIGLVSDVEQQPILRGIEHALDRDGQLDDAEIGREMPAGLCDVLHQKLPQLFTKLLQLLCVQRAKILSGIDLIQQIQAYTTCQLRHFCFPIRKSDFI